MKVTKRFLLSPLLILMLLSACKKDDGDDDFNYENPYINDDTAGVYTNPVFSPVLADPSVIKVGDFFYAYGTEDDWGSDGGYHLVPVIRSTDLVNWDFVRDAFDVKPNWKTGGIWAPDVEFVNGQYHMYYSFSEWGDPNPGIGLATAPSPQGPFTDQGKLFDSNEIGVGNSIDAFYYELNDSQYLFWGSFQGIYGIQLNAAGTDVIGNKTQIAGNHLEASYIYRKDGYFYYFGSVGSCCEGANSTYRVLVGRSPSLMGPYVDKNGNNLLNGGGTLVVEANPGNTGFAGPGHNAEIMVDDEGTEWFLYHGIPKSNPNLDNGASRRPLLMDKIIWEDGWPLIEGRVPSLVQQPAPIFN